MAESDSDGDDYRRSEMGRSLGHREIVEILEEQEEGESDTTSDEEEEGEEEEDGEDDEDVNYIPVEDSPVRNEIGNTASTSSRITSGQGGRDNKRRRLEEGEADASSPGCSASHGSEWSRSEIDGLFCPICMEPWTNDGDHHICCLPCGHIYGLSCIKRWLQQQKKNTAKCPQCNRRWTLKDVRKLFASRIVTVDEESQKRIQQLEATCAALERKDAGWKKKEFEWKNKKTESEKRIEKLQQKITQLQERTTYLERLLEEAPTRLTGSAVAEMGCQGHFSGSSIDLGFPTKQPSYIFEQKMELRMEGARVFDVSALYQILFVSRRLHGMVGRETLTKISLMYPREVEDIPLPSNTKAVKDLHISPANGDHVLFATLGKSLAVLSLESNNVVLTYNLPAAAWSCSWDFQRPYHIYAGLQNGTLMVFDMRQTSRPIESLNGLSFNPIHTIRSFSQNSTNGASSILTASSIGLCLWNIDCHEERPTLVPESANNGVCISVACSCKGEDIVATYRPKIEAYTDVLLTQPTPNPSPVSGQATQGSHVLFRRGAGSDSFHKSGSEYANVSDIRLPRSVIVSSEDREGLFASGDEATNALVLQGLPSFKTSQVFNLRKHPLRDIRYSNSAGRVGLLTCLSDDIFQVFRSGHG